VQQPPQRGILRLQLRGTRLRAMRGVSERAGCEQRCAKARVAVVGAP
jgi:hypothetical protein